VNGLPVMERSVLTPYKAGSVRAVYAYPETTLVGELPHLWLRLFAESFTNSGASAVVR